MRRSNRNFNIPPPPPSPGKPRALEYLLGPGRGEFDLCLREVGALPGWGGGGGGGEVSS